MEVLGVTSDAALECNFHISKRQMTEPMMRLLVPEVVISFSCSGDKHKKL